MKQRAIILLVLTFLLSATVGLAKEGKPQTKCPICKMDINKDLYADHKGKRVYFGCAGCPEQFKKDADRYIAEMEAAGIQLATSPVQQDRKHVQVTCACGADHPDYSIFADASGKRIFFCSTKCSEHFQTAPEANLRTLQKKGMQFEDTPRK